MAKDISKKVVLVMLVLDIVLSVTGTWLVLDNVNQASGRGNIVVSEDLGNVRLAIGDFEEVGVPEPSLDDGNVQLEIK